MTKPDKKRALSEGGAEAAIELVKLIPGAGALIEGVRKYHDSIEEQQRAAFVERLESRVSALEGNREWYQSEEGELFVKKVVATALNAEYADKLDFLANALVSGPQVEGQAMRLKMVEMIRQVSRTAIDVLVAALNNPSGTGEVISADIAKAMGWHPALVDACVQELYALGAFSHVTAWRDQGSHITSAQGFSRGTPALTDISRAFVEFVSE